MTAVPPVADGSVAVHDRRSSWLPTISLIRTRRLELRKRRGLMIAVLLLTVGLPVIFLGIRLILHLISPSSYGPAGSPSIFSGICDPMYAFGFIISATLGAAAGTTDLTDGMFRHLVVTGRSRLALYFARIPAGLSILVPLMALAFTILCVVTSFLGTPQPSRVNADGINVPLHLDEAHFESFLLGQSDQTLSNLGAGAQGVVGDNGPFGGRQVRQQARPVSPALVRARIRTQIDDFYDDYRSAEQDVLSPLPNEMVKIGLWLELEVVIGFTVGLGFGSLVGQRTVATVIMIVLQIIITPIAANVNIKHFVNAQRLIVGVAMDQLRPAGLPGGFVGHGGHGQGVLGIPTMPTWAMVGVIVAWIAGWTAIGAWRMVTRDA